MIRKVALFCLGLLSIIALFHWLTGRWVDFHLWAVEGDLYAWVYLPARHSEERRNAWDRFHSPHGEGGIEWKSFDLKWISAETWVEPIDFESARWERAIEVRSRAWLLFLACGAYPTVAFIRGPLRRWRRRRKGQCAICGYDLTGNTSGRCPECGRPV